MALTTAVVLNWRRPRDTLRCVESLIRLRRDLDIVIVDNHSGDGSLDMIAEGVAQAIAAGGSSYVFQRLQGLDRAPALVGRSVRLLDSGQNGGYAFGNNVGIRVALQRNDCRFLWILNNDVLVPDGSSLDRLIEKMATNQNIGLCGSTVAYLKPEGVVQTLGGGAFDPKRGRCVQLGQGARLSDPVDEQDIESRLAYINGAAAFVRRTFVEEIGPMSEDYFLYFEEIDWIMRARGRFRLGFCSQSIVYHTVGASIGTDDFGYCSPLSAYYLTRNRLKFLARHARASLPAAVADLLKDTVRELRRGRLASAAIMAQAMLGLPFRSAQNWK